ncbi:hypothetical protein [Leptospira perdikensis]|uniref:Uncharacterized protein n=1 Tax=Leptospira perdikensis TaxID=2484948 RepID=A0A4R9JNA6_9LEPT|nr:hypothetical protein [Leptospira perdikensis]TGL45824.1 hypothetical protein EHQ49_00095 [Leptospira perdikensis]
MYKYKTIVFLVETPFTKRDEERFGIAEIRSNGLEVVVYQLSQIFHKEEYKDREIDNNDQKLVYDFSNLADLRKALTSGKTEKIVILLMTQYLVLLKLLNQISVDYSLHFTNQIPSVSVKSDLSVADKIKVFLSENGFIGAVFKVPLFALNFIKNRIKKGILNPKYVIAGGKYSILSLSEKIRKSAKIVWAHSLDYDQYLRGKEIGPTPDFYDIYGKKYPVESISDAIVFLDEYSPYHPDNAFFGIAYADKPETYYPTLEKFFAHLETIFQKKVVVAAHPRSEYTDKDHFKEFIVIRGRTNDLIQSSSFALLHSSTSINFVNLYQKPAIFFYTSTMTDRYKQMTNLFAEWHNANSVEIGLESDLSQFDFYKLINKPLDYTKYKDSFIKTLDSENDYSWNIFLNEFRV